MKTAVLVNIPFYTYNDEIIASLKSKGYDVIHFSYKPAITSFQKFRFKYSKHYRNKAIKRLVSEMVEKLHDLNIDIFIFINPTTFVEDDLKLIFEGHENSKKVLYLWDAVKTYPIVKEIFNCFDKIYSFDLVDCKEYGFIYRPTFASHELFAHIDENVDLEYDVFYVASYSKKRYFQLLKMSQICEENGLKFKYHLYVRNKLAYFFFKLNNLKLKKKYISTKLLSNAEKTDILLKSKAIFDTPLDTQTGITMRVIEGMIMNKKIITTNTHINEFEFYNPNDFLVFDDKFNINCIKSICSYKIDTNYYSVNSLVEDLLKWKK